MSEFHRFQRFYPMMFSLIFSSFLNNVAAKNLTDIQGKIGKNVYGQELLTPSEQKEYLTMIRSIKLSNEQNVFLMEHRETVRVRALASGISWICLDVHPFVWVLSPKQLLPTAIQVASQECNQRNLRSEHGAGK